MNKTLKVILGILAVVAIAATVSYAVYRLLNKEGKKPLAVFKSKFNDDGSVEAVEVSEEELITEDAVKEAPATPCNDAVCAVDMCMPY